VQVHVGTQSYFRCLVLRWSLRRGRRVGDEIIYWEASADCAPAGASPVGFSRSSVPLRPAVPESSPTVSRESDFQESPREVTLKISARPAVALPGKLLLFLWTVYRTFCRIAHGGPPCGCNPECHSGTRVNLNLLDYKLVSRWRCLIYCNVLCWY
jgi:hypothetical protein